ncbi:MAG: hypothetical protein KFF73_17935 [Cyclobacteriaceae bacterium]|nr:hypothetical protein [Cyclobacteriaceae bacterium]
MNLIDRLELARRIYLKAAGRVTDEFMAGQFQTIASKKEVFIREISNLFDFDYEKHSLDLKDKIKVEWEEIGIELNHLILDRNERALMEYCIRREQGILKIYRDILKGSSIDDLFNTVVRNQMDETTEILDELTNSLEPSHYRGKNK